MTKKTAMDIYIVMDNLHILGGLVSAFISSAKKYILENNMYTFGHPIDIGINEIINCNRQRSLEHIWYCIKLEK